MSEETAAAGAAIRPVVLSGGSGTRLWPLSRRARPKQFVPLAGRRSLFAETLARVSGPPFAPPLVIASARHEALVADELAQAGETAASVLLEPEGRNTAAAVAAAALWARRRGADEEVLALLPADHHIADAAAFRQALAAAAELARREPLIVTLGIAPDRPATGYGYIEAGAALGPHGFALRRFHEKPDARTAARYLARGGFYWNAGIFVARARSFADAFAAHAPELWRAVEAAMADLEPTAGGAARLPAGPWARVPAISFDYAVMEKTEDAAVIPVACGWSDVGSFDALLGLIARDESGNALSGPVTVEEARDCLVWSRGPRVAVHGLSDVVVIAEEDAVLVIPAAAAQEVRRLVARLAEEDPDRL